jgi:hypothetical protein
MEKSLTFNLLVALFALLCSATTKAQETSSWVKVAPSGESFTVMMPHKPSPVAEKRKHGALSVSGKRYSARGSDDTIYTVWSFKSENFPAALRADTESYLDLCAELAWEMSVEPERAKAVRESRTTPETRYELIYEGESQPPDYPGRKYRLNLGTQSGTTIVHVAGSRFYIAAAWNPDRVIGKIDEFIDSFTLHPPMRAGGEGTGRNDDDEQGYSTSKGESKKPDYDKIFSIREVTHRARILSKPEPLYDEWARKFQVAGTARLRVALMSFGKVGKITIMVRLPHGLTQKAIEAARGIKFTPAMKDGRPVSQYVIVEYNFNIY